jgi:hypothetical protein
MGLEEFAFNIFVPAAVLLTGLPRLVFNGTFVSPNYRIFKRSQPTVAITSTAKMTRSINA